MTSMRFRMSAIRASTIVRSRRARLAIFSTFASSSSNTRGGTDRANEERRGGGAPAPRRAAAPDLTAQGDGIPLRQSGAREEAVVRVQPFQLALDGASGDFGPLDLRMRAHLLVEFLGERERHVRHGAYVGLR